MAVGQLLALDLVQVADLVGAPTFKRGADYASSGRVLDARWDPDELVLEARVLGNGAVYATEAWFDHDEGGIHFVGGSCSCPVGADCKHVTALVIQAVTPVGQGSTTTMPPRRRTAARPAHREPPEPTWDQSLQTLIGGEHVMDAAPVVAHGQGRLAIELRLETGAGGQLLARVMRRGRDRWVYGQVSWGTLDHWDGGHRPDPDQVQVLHELHALHASSLTRSRRPYSGSYRDTAKLIDLTRLGVGLWPLLDDLAEVGVPLLYSNHSLGEVAPHQPGRFSLDVTRPEADAGLVLRPRLTVEGRASGDDDVTPLLFLGQRGHGAVVVDRATLAAGDDHRSWRWGLVRLAGPTPTPLRDLVRADRPIQIPSGEEERFAQELWPSLRQVAPITSSDGSFTPPVIEGPRLVLHVSYGAGHVADALWAWSYVVGDAEHRLAVGDDPGSDTAAGYRDVDAERDLVAGLDDAGLRSLGLIGRRGLVSPVRLTGLDTARLATEVLPLLDDDPRVIVEVAGEPADFREVSDSLVIGVSTEAAPGETDWFDLGVTVTADGREVPFLSVFHALAAGQAHLLLPDGAYFSLLKPELQGLRALIEEARELSDQPAGELRISRYQIDLWDELSNLGVVARQAEAWERQTAALRSIRSPDAGPAEPPATLTADLRSYQRDGFAWLRFLWDCHLGGVLADDMGLGKTVQTLALMCHAREQDPDLAPFLVVAPTSVVPNWVSEAARFAPHLKVTSITDTLRKSGRSLDEAIAGAHVVVTTYGLLRLDADAYQSRTWAGMLLDEAQHTKNHRSKTYASIRQVPAPFKLAITGTPMENNLMELWSLLSIVAPGLFPHPGRFAEQYARPIEREGDTELLARLRRRVKPLMKRRTKELVAADLPAKQEQVLEVELHPQHRKLYQTHLQRERQKILGLLGDFDRNRFTILRSLTLLRQLSLHPVLVDEDKAKVPCVKLDALAEQLHEIADAGHRALVFSQFTGFLRHVRDRLDHEGIEHCYLDGRTRGRDKVVERFKTGTAPAFLISLKAGGVGLNLTEADYCFLLDPWWNPATEAQAVDRTHRIGQTRNVMVYRMIARGTIEEKVLALQQRKADLFRGVMDDGDLFSQALAADDVRALFE